MGGLRGMGYRVVEQLGAHGPVHLLCVSNNLALDDMAPEKCITGSINIFYGFLNLYSACTIRDAYSATSWRTHVYT